jgi:hypothetical protein
MPQLVAIALIGGVIWYAWRALKREMGRIGNEVAEHEHKAAAKKAPVLEKGPDGVYRPRDPRA